MSLDPRDTYTINLPGDGQFVIFNYQAKIRVFALLNFSLESALSKIGWIQY